MIVCLRHLHIDVPLIYFSHSAAGARRLWYHEHFPERTRNKPLPISATCFTFNAEVSKEFLPLCAGTTLSHSVCTLIPRNLCRPLPCIDSPCYSARIKGQPYHQSTSLHRRNQKQGHIIICITPHLAAVFAGLSWLHAVNLWSIPTGCRQGTSYPCTTNRRGISTTF